MLKKYFYTTIFALSVLIVIGSSEASAAEIWSSPDYTEQWSSPVPATVEQETTAPEGTKEVPPALKQDNSPSIYISLQIGSKLAQVQGKNIELDVPPGTVEGRTMVPVRFIGEALSAEIGWDSKTQQVTVSLRDKKIILTLGKSIAIVDDTLVELDAPPVSKDGRTLVPLRFISENLNLNVNYVAETKTIEITDKSSINNNAPAEEIKPAEAEKTVKEPEKEAVQDENESAVGFEKLYGTWYIWTPGSITNLYDKTTGNYVTHDYDPGADQGKIVINKDGTYSMTHAAWAKGQVAEGKWRLSFPAEINGDRIQAIVLQDGLTGVDWAVAPSTGSEKIRLVYAMKWSDGSATWIFDSELYKK